MDQGFVWPSLCLLLQTFANLTPFSILLPIPFPVLPSFVRCSLIAMGRDDAFESHFPFCWVSRVFFPISFQFPLIFFLLNPTCDPDILLSEMIWQHWKNYFVWLSDFQRAWTEFVCDGRNVEFEKCNPLIAFWWLLHFGFQWDLQFP